MMTVVMTMAAASTAALGFAGDFRALGWSRFCGGGRRAIATLWWRRCDAAAGKNGKRKREQDFLL